jgi:hypothetical protein
VTVLVPSATARFGNLRYDRHITALSADLGLLPATNAVTAILPRDVEIDAVPGDPAEVTIDGGDGGANVLTGSVRAVRRTAATTVVTATDAGADLAHLRPAATYEGQSVAEIAGALVREAGASAGTMLAPVRLAAYVAHQQRTAAEHVARLAELGGAIACVEADGSVTLKPRPLGLPDAALRYGRELIAYRVEDQPAPPAAVVVGNGPAGIVPFPNAFQHTTDPLTAGGGQPGADAVWDPAHALRMPLAVEAAAKEANARRAADAQRVMADCWLLPSVRPGQLVEVQDLPDRLSGGPWLVTSVVHVLDGRGGGTTSIRGVVGGDALGGLLGAALSAIGSLL